MKKYLICVTAALLFESMSLCSSFYSRVNEINPMTGDISFVTIGIIAGIALVAIIAFVVMGKMNKKR